MKYIITVVAVFFLTVGAHAQSKRNGKYDVQGFRDIKWGQHIDSVYSNKSKLNFIKSDVIKDANAYYLDNDDLTIGTVNLNSITYFFTDRAKFTRVVLKADKKFFTDLKYILTYKFDESHGQKMINSNNVFIWNLDDVRVTLSDGNGDGMAVVEFYVDYNMLEFKSINRNVSDF